uniref:FA complementation group G n=1 Tax=Podarcis muralis TaxID=64176 RepID=A0A670J8T2_PODMU
LSLLQMWQPPDLAESDPLLVQSVPELKGILWTSAAFLQGVQELEAGDLPAAVALLQTAASGLCSRRRLAQIFTLMGCCNLKMDKPQMAIQYLKRALQVDFTFLPALYQASLLYHQLGLLEAELEVLALLYQVHLHPSLPNFLSTLGSEAVFALLCVSCSLLWTQHLLILGWGPPPLQVSLCGELALPRIPEVFLEAASALEELARHRDAILDLGARKRESLLCVLWRAAAYLIQGLAWAGLGEAKEAISHLSSPKMIVLCSFPNRCLNDLLRVHFVTAGMDRDAYRQFLSAFLLAGVISGAGESPFVGLELAYCCPRWEWFRRVLTSRLIMP